MITASSPSIPVRMVYSPHPLLASAGRRLIGTPFIDGESIAGYLDRVQVNLDGQPVVLMLNDLAIPRDQWATTFPRHTDMIIVRAAVQDGGGGGSNPLKTILTIALLVYAPALVQSTGIWMSPAMYSAAVAAVTVGGMLVINALFPPPVPDLSHAQGRQNTESPTYSLSGGSNRARPYEPLPLVMGTHRIFPDLDTREYTEFLGDDQYLYQTYNFGLADMDISDFRIGNTPLTDFDDVEYEISGADGALTLFPGNVDTIAGAALTAAAGWVQRTSSINATGLAIDITGSLYRAGNDGLEARSVSLELEYRAVGSGTWLPFVGGTSAVTLTSASRNPVRKSYKINVTKGQYEVRLRRTSPDETDARNISDMSFNQLRTYQPDEADYTGQKRMALKIRASGQLNGRVQQFSGLGEAKADVWNGSSWVADQITSNPAWLFLGLARGKFDLGGRRIYGAGLADIKIDIEALKEWGAWCDSKSLACNLVFDRSMSTIEMLNAVARCGRAATTHASGKLGVVWDQGGQPITQVFGMNNIISGSFSIEYTSGKVTDEIVCQFINPDLDWQQDTVRATVPGVTTPTRPATIELFGVTDKDQAGREANLLAARQSFHRRRIKWETDVEGLSCNRGDVVTLSHDLTQWGYSGRLIAGDTVNLTLSRAVPFTSGQTHYIGVRKPDGTYEIVRVQYQAGSSDQLALIDALTFSADADPDHPAMDYTWVFEPKATPGKKVKIVDIEPMSLESVRIIAIDEDDGYYQSEQNAYTYVTPGTYGGEIPSISGLVLSEDLVRASSGYNTSIVLTWDVSGPYGGAKIRTSMNGGPYVDRGATFARRFEFAAPDTGTLNVEVTVFDYLGRFGPNSQATLVHNIAGKDLPPGDVDSLIVQAQPDGTREYIWSMTQPPADLAGYKIRYKNGTTATWATMNDLHDGVLTASPFESNQIPAGTYVIAIKAVDTSGNESINDTQIVVELPDPRIAGVFLSAGMYPHWPGTKTNCYIDNNGHLVATDTKTWADFFLDGVTWADWTSWARSPNTPITYEHTVIDIGVEVTFTPIITVLGNGTPTNEISYSSNGVDYSAWEAPGLITARYLKVRTQMGGAYPQIYSGKVMLDAEPLKEDINDLDTSTLTGAYRIGVGDIRLPITNSYALITQVPSVIFQNVGGGGWTWELIDKDATVGPRIKLYNNGVLADASIDAQVRGL